MAKILIAENSQTTQDFIKNALKRYGHKIDTVANSLDAWRATGREYYDIMIVNVMMPGIDGFVLAQKALQENPDIQIIFVTGFAAVAMDTYATPAYAPVPMTSRPFHIREIAQRVRYLMGEADMPSTTIFTAKETPDNVVYGRFGSQNA